MFERITGQDIAVRIIRDGVLQNEITTIKSVNLVFEMARSEEDYIGETSMRYDSKFNGLAVKMELHSENKQGLLLIQAIVLKAQRRAGGAVRIDIACSLLWPNGDKLSLMAKDVAFADLPFGFDGRKEFGKIELDGKCSEFTLKP
jgi:hypothetical protein